MLIQNILDYSLLLKWFKQNVGDEIQENKTDVL